MCLGKKSKILGKSGKNQWIPCGKNVGTLHSDLGWYSLWMVFHAVSDLLFCRGIRDDLENEDDEESYYRYMEENPLAGVNMDDDELDIEYDEDGNAIIPEHKKV